VQYFVTAGRWLAQHLWRPHYPQKYFCEAEHLQPLYVFRIAPLNPMRINKPHQFFFLTNVISIYVISTSMAFEISFCFRDKKVDTFVNNRPACCEVDSKNGVRSDGLSEAGVFLDWVGGGYPCRPLSETSKFVVSKVRLLTLCSKYVTPRYTWYRRSCF